MNPTPHSPTYLIDIQELVKAYDLLPVLRKLTLQVTHGEFVALLGPNGSGKSTLLRILCGLSRATAGSIRVGGWKLPDEIAAVRAQIGLVSHKSLLYDNLSAYENLRFFAQLYNLPNADARIAELLAQVGLQKRTHALVRTFSRGMLQRLSIARALLHNPDILLLDEPYTGLDQDASAILDSLLKAAHDEGRTIIMTTHDLNRAAILPTRIVILSRGVIGYDQPAGVSAVELASLYTEITSMVTT
ncbi:MAG: heme ABC exporter ATP-binding protein CcmA [Chloroflexi bacterium]|nr:heme ABC exporter ATP-binding protein CcmA [Chloroflexota bacterium]MCC6895790.1 heme ABC exporter ATP-binding protein CcmA [Anaerolineae bacterium]